MNSERRVAVLVKRGSRAIEAQCMESMDWRSAVAVAVVGRHKAAVHVRLLRWRRPPIRPRKTSPTPSS